MVTFNPKPKTKLIKQNASDNPDSAEQPAGFK
jgi:hypothetical protein